MKRLMLSLACALATIGTVPAGFAQPNVDPSGPGYRVEGQKRTPSKRLPGASNAGAQGAPVGVYHSWTCSNGGAGGDCIGGTCSDGSAGSYWWITDPRDGSTISEGVGCAGTTAPAQVTPGAVASALRRIPLPPSQLIIQPPKGKTLINFKTNFYTHRRTLHRTVTVLGQRVSLRITAAGYTWHFGDGASKTTRTPGAPYPQLQVTHNYRKKGHYRPRLATTYVADFRVGRGAWRPVTGSVTITGPTQHLQAISARPTLVGSYDGDD